MAPQRFLTRLLTIFPVCTFHSRDLFYNWKFVSPNAFPIFTHLPPPCSSGNHQFVLCVSDSISVLFPVFSYLISEVPHINKTVWYLSFSVCLVPLGIIPSGPSMLSTMTRFDSFLLLSNISLCVSLCVCVCVCVCDFFLIDSPIDGHWGSFHILAIVNSAAVNREAHVSFVTNVSSSLQKNTKKLNCWIIS